MRRFALLFAFALALFPSLAQEVASAGATIESRPVSSKAHFTKIELDAFALCIQAGWFPDGAYPRLREEGCVSPLAGDAMFWVLLGQEQYSEAKLKATFLVPGAPAAGSSSLGVQFLNHLVVGYAFDPDGIGMAPIADQGDFPPAPAALQGNIIGKVAYGTPFEVIVQTSTENHRVHVVQGDRTVLDATLVKAFPHPDPLSIQNRMEELFPRTVPSGLEWAFVSADLRVVKSEEVQSFPYAPYLGGVSLERLGNAIRIVNIRNP